MTKFSSTEIAFAHKLDSEDELASFRGEFVIDDPNLIYLDGNSLGRLPKRSIDFMKNAIEEEWGKRLIRVWNDGWVNMPTELGAKIAKLVGAKADEILVTEATSINLFKLAVAALQVRPKRTEIISDEFNFPSDLYILQGIIELLGDKHQLKLISSEDSISISSEAVQSAINENTALVSLTHVAFKSAFMYDMKKITEMAHQAGALMLWDLSHSVGAVPLDLNGYNVDLAVGCTYKYLNGGPGAPAFLYVRRDLQEKLMQPMWGWFASEKPFDFDLNFSPAKDISRYRVGTPPMLSMKAVEPAVDILLEASMEKLREKSLRQTAYFIFLADQWLEPLGFKLGTPRQKQERGSHVSLRHPESFRITRALIESPVPAIRVIPDFRAPDNIRFGITPLYTTFTGIYQAIARIREIVEGKKYEEYSNEQLAVT
ncbi:MAG: kynureninase [Anaerolineae bacterium]|jgi:kynureninase|nr:kynureninase [Anaerolineae bacterium]MBT7189248.1 kynureninase [Anaerolineae bacterium]MBT7991339.1 kynureninase [Anaerolineae bacterium]